VPGVVEVNAWGGELKTYQVSLDPARLVSYKIPLDKIFDSLQKNNTNAGGAYIIHGGEQYVIRGEGLIENVRDIENIIVDARNGTPIYVKNIGKVEFAPMVRQGAVTRDGRGEAVTGFVMMLIGENSREVVNRVKERVAAIQKSLPSGVTIEPYYDCTELIKRTIATVSTNLIEGGVLVIAVLLLLLGNLRAGLIVASAIPLSMLVAFTAMLYAGVSGNLMSLGAIDFGLVVDGAVLMIENIVRHLRERRPQTAESHTGVILEAGREVIRPIFFAVGIIIIVYLPILTLQGIEGKLFRPMAITVIFALTAALVISLTVIPVLAAFFLKREVKEKETFVISGSRRIYTPALKWGLAHPGMTAILSAAVFALSALLVPFMGAEFIPRLEEGSLAIQASRIPSISLEESVKSAAVIEKTLKRFPEVETVVSRTGRAEIATDPMGVETSDVYIALKPKEEWKTASSREGLIAAMDKALEENAPGLLFSYSQPIELRYQELIAGVRSDVAVNIFGDDLKLLKEKADEVVRLVSRIRGAADTKAEQVAGLSYLRIKIRRDAIARYGLNASEVLEAIETLGGKELGQVLEGNRRFALQVRFEERDREDVDKIRNISISAGQGKLVPLAQLADILVEEGPAQISRENVQRRIAVETNVRGRDLAGFVAEAQAAVEKRVKMPQGYWIEWGGQFENLQRATERLTIVVPLALLLMFVLLFMTFNAVGPAALIFLNVPLAATGGIFSLFLRGMPFSISAGVGFIAVFGVAVMNGIVLIAHIIGLRKEGLSVTEAVMRGTEEKMRAMIMAPAVAALGFVPMAISTSAGAEVQRPLATVVIGGIVTSTLLTLIVLPSIYAWMERRREARESREGEKL
jgi:cobalt-zinc-cadmium resistance protein CzcA